jgi:hypothetical protein
MSDSRAVYTHIQIKQCCIVCDTSRIPNMYCKEVSCYA